MAETKQPTVKYLVRIANTDVDGQKQTMYALSKVKGVSIMLANCLCEITSTPKDQKIGTLSDAQVQKLNAVLSSPVDSIPNWMLNRRKDPETNEPTHIVGPNLRFVQDNDVKNMRRIKSYKGTRHSKGLPVRGQRTKSNFRKSKSRGKGSLGVKRKGK